MDYHRDLDIQYIYRGGRRRDLGSRVWDSGFWIQGLGFRVYNTNAS